MEDQIRLVDGVWQWVKPKPRACSCPSCETVPDYVLTCNDCGAGNHITVGHLKAARKLDIAIPCAECGSPYGIDV